jgi:uncharacterized protein YpmB
MFVFAGFVLFVAVLFVLFVRSVNADYRAEENRAIALAKTQGGLVRVDAAVQYTWEEPVWVVRGRDRNKHTWIVWERRDGLVKEQESLNYPESQMRERFAAERPTAKPLRVVPGWFRSKPVWEIRYEDRASTSGGQAIAFYSFKDGTLLTTYELPGY